MLLRPTLVNAILSLAVCFAFPAYAQNTPAFDFQNVMDTYFDDTSGLISFGDYTVAFTPEGSFDGFVAVLDSEGEIVGQHAFYPEYVNREGVFARVRAVGPADVALTTPGFYTIVFVVGGQPVTRFLVRLVQTSAGDGPFDPVKRFRFDGYWRTLAYFTIGTSRDESIPQLTLWLGGMDLVDDQRGSFLVALRRGDEVIAHSKRNQAAILPGHFRRTMVNLFHPHAEGEEDNATFLTMQALETDGRYQLRVERLPDGELLRTYDFDVASGEILGLARSELGHDPHPDYIMPYVLASGATGLEMTPAIWIQRRQ